MEKTMNEKTAKAREYNKRYREKMGDEAFKAKRAEMNRAWIEKNRDQYNKSKSYYRFSLKVEAISHYSDGTMCCTWCGYKEDIDALTLDHIEDNGAEHRRELGCSSRGGNSGTTMYERLKALGWQPGLQVLCSNCNTIKAIRLRRGTTSDEMMAMPKPRWRK